MTQKEPTEEEKRKQARNKYIKEWRARNKDKVKQYNENYWLRRSEVDREQR